MLFSHEAVAGYLNANFECAWESVRPVPQVDIDFGNGRRLHRTLNGNIATYFCTPEGRVYDILPGLASPEEFMRRAWLSRQCYEQIKSKSEHTPTMVRMYHLRMKELEPALTGASNVAGVPYVIRSDRTKSGVEIRIKEVLLPDWHENSANGKPEASAADRDGILADVAYNREHRYPLVHDLLTDKPLKTPAELTKTVYKEILHVDLDDPYLGLAPYVLGGEIGRR